MESRVLKLWSDSITPKNPNIYLKLSESQTLKYLEYKQEIKLTYNLLSIIRKVKRESTEHDIKTVIF